MHLIVADSSPLIYLTRLGFFSLLRILHDSVIVPASVWNEVVIGGAGLPESKALQTAVADGWIQVMAPTVNAPYPSCHAVNRGKIRFAFIHSLDATLRSFTKSANATVGCTLVRM